MESRTETPQCASNRSINWSKYFSLPSSDGRPITQSLFLEIGYTEHAVYTLKDDDYEYNGKVYPSLKKAYLELEDTTEYDFANQYL